MVLSTFLKPGSIVGYMSSVNIYRQYVQLRWECGYVRDRHMKVTLIQV